MSSAVRSLCVASWLCASLPMRADAADPPPIAADPQDIAEANALFRQGKSAMAEGRVAEACDWFEKSLALARRSGVLINLADCQEKAGRYATAERLFRQTLEMVIAEGQTSREKYARAHITGLQPKLAWLEFELPPDATASGLVVTCDDLPVTGGPLAVDPGAHVATVVDRTGARTDVPIRDVKPGERRVVRIAPPMRPVATSTPREAPTISAAPTASLAPAAPVTAPAAATQEPPRWLRPVGIAALGVGTAALSVGLVLSARAHVDNQASRVLCPDDQCPTMDGFARNHAARTAALGATIAVPAGLVGIATAVTLLLVARPKAPSGPKAPAASKIGATAPASDRERRPFDPGWSLVPGVDPGGGGVWLTGTF